MAIGARSQSGRTYLEKHFESFEGASLDELIKHALLALRETLSTGQELSPQSVAVGYVGKQGGFTLLEDDTIAPYIESVKRTEGEAGAAPMEAEGGAEGAAGGEAMVE
jgi:20S proteasome subunit alpha 6